MKRLCTRAVSWISVMALLVTMIAVCGFGVSAAEEAKVLFSENFDSYANGTLPTNWVIKSDSGITDVSVQDGGLVINGLGSDAQTRVFYGGSELANYGDYVFEADYTILASDYALSSSTRYSSMVFRANNVSTTPYYYYTTSRVRTGTTENELSIRYDSAEYKQIDWSAPPASMSLNTTYHFKVVANGANIKFYIDNAMVFNTTLSTSGDSYWYLPTGSIGFTTSNLKIKMDNIVVSDIPTTTGEVLYAEDFNSCATNTLPENWLISSDSGYEAIAVHGGELEINGIGTDLQTRVVYMGPELLAKGDYSFEADYTIVESPMALTSSTRYSAMMFRVQQSVYPYYYCTTRVRPGTNNELSVRKTSDSSSYKQLALTNPTVQQEIGVTYHLKVVCRGANVQYYIDDVMVFNHTLDKNSADYPYLSAGTIGFTTSNMRVRFDNIVVKEIETTVELQPAMYDTYIPTTDLVNPPAVITDVLNTTTYTSMTGTKLPSSSIYYINSDLNVMTPDGKTKITSLANALNFTNGKVIPALFVKDTETVDALKDFVSQSALQDAFLVSDNGQVLKYARSVFTNFYGVYYKKLTTAVTEQNLREMVTETNAAWAKTVMVDADFISKDEVEYLQKCLINVWVTNVTTIEQAFNNISKGVNGIVSPIHGTALYAIESFNSGTPIIIRKPFMYAHRGYSAVAAQNTIPAFEAAAQYGADHVEMDIRRTKDGRIVLYHDEYLYTLTNCTDQTKTVENSTYAELMQYRVHDNAGYSEKIITLEEFLTFLAGTDMIGIVEIKHWNDTALVIEAARIIKEMKMDHQVVSICFTRVLCDLMREQLPTVSVGWLANANSNTTPEAILTYAKGWIMSGNLSYHPNYGQISSSWGSVMHENVIESFAQRGLAINPWTYNDENAFTTAYINGIQGLTTDYLNYGNYAVRGIKSGSIYNMASGVATRIQALGETATSHALYNCIVKRTGGANITVTNNSNGTVTATGSGTFTGIVMYKASIQSKEYYVMSELVGFRVSSSGGVNATEDYYTSLLPSHTAGWVNYIAGMNINVERDKRGDVLINTTGGYPAVKNNMSLTVPLSAEITYDVTVDALASFVIMLADGTAYRLQSIMDGVTLSGDDLVGNGKRFVGRIKLADLIPSSKATNGNITIGMFGVFNVGDVGDTLTIRRMDIVEQVPAYMGTRGDFDRDNDIDTLDVRHVLLVTLGVQSMTYRQETVADANYDGVVNSSDARAILIKIANA